MDIEKALERQETRLRKMWFALSIGVLALCFIIMGIPMAFLFGEDMVWLIFWLAGMMCLVAGTFIFHKYNKEFRKEFKQIGRYQEMRMRKIVERIEKRVDSHSGVGSKPKPK